MPTLTTARLRLRPPELDDAPAMFAAWPSDPPVTRYVTWPTHTKESYVQECRARRDAGAACDWLITLRPNGEPLGSIELRLHGHRAELGYVLARPR